MYYGVDFPNFGRLADCRVLIGLAREAEAAGWDGFFLWDHIAGFGAVPMVDPWVALTAVALNTERLRFGPMVTPLARRRPWQVARQAVSLDQLSGGRLILGVGTGGRAEEWEHLGDPGTARERAERLDEELDILIGLWSGERFSYEGDYYQLKEAQFLPTPVQKPRIPIWVADKWPNKPPLRRAAKWDGVFSIRQDLDYTKMMPVEEIREMTKYVAAYRESSEPFDVVHYALTTGEDVRQDREVVQAYAEAGVTWWVENMVPIRWGTWDEWSLEGMHDRVRKGPPRI